MLFHFISGICLGLAQLVPGLSSATIAVVLGLYDAILQAFNRCIRHPFSSWSSLLFLFTLSMGVCAGFVFFSKALLFILRMYPVLSAFSFMGLVLGTIPFFYQTYLCKYNFSFKSNVIFIVFFLFVAVFAFIPHVSLINLNNYSSIMFYLFLFISGFLTSMAMLVPGLSGSLVLLLLGAYDFILNAILTKQIDIIFIFSLGICVGFLLMAQFVQYLLKRFQYYYYVAVLALLLGSVCGLWPANIQSVWQLSLGFCLCFLMAFMMRYLTFKFKKASIA